MYIYVYIYIYVAKQIVELILLAGSIHNFVNHLGIFGEKLFQMLQE